MGVQYPSPQTTLLVLLGASAWPFMPEFQRSEAFANAARRLKAYFLNPRPFGLPTENLLDLFDADKSADELDIEIGQFLERRLAAMKATRNPARDLLLYFIGHGGFVGRDSDFYLAILSLVTFVCTELWSSSALANDRVPSALSSRIGIQREPFDTSRKYRDRRLAIEPGGIERAMPKQGCQPDEIARILRQVIAGEGVPQYMRAGLFRDKGTCRLHQVSNHLPHCRGRERSPLLAFEEREKRFG